MKTTGISFIFLSDNLNTEAKLIRSLSDEYSINILPVAQNNDMKFMIPDQNM